LRADRRACGARYSPGRAGRPPTSVQRRSMRSISVSVALAASLLAGGCSIDSLVSPYRIDVRQGNYVDQQMVAQLRRGMTREQVRFVLGTPLVVDMFRENRWDYVYRHTEGWNEPQTRRLSLFFVDDKLDSVE